jgi:hypothetical protein
LAREHFDGRVVGQEIDFDFRQGQWLTTFETFAAFTGFAATAIRARTAMFAATIGARSTRTIALGTRTARAALATKTAFAWAAALRAITTRAAITTITATTATFRTIFAAVAGVFIDGRTFLGPCGQEQLL